MRFLKAIQRHRGSFKGLFKATLGPLKDHRRLYLGTLKGNVRLYRAPKGTIEGYVELFKGLYNTKLWGLSKKGYVRLYGAL